MMLQISVLYGNDAIMRDRDCNDKTDLQNYYKLDRLTIRN